VHQGSLPAGNKLKYNLLGSDLRCTWDHFRFVIKSIYDNMGSDPWCTRDHFRWAINFDIIRLEVISGAPDITSGL